MSAWWSRVSRCWIGAIRSARLNANPGQPSNRGRGASPCDKRMPNRGLHTVTTKSGPFFAIVTAAPVIGPAFGRYDDLRALSGGPRFFCRDVDSPRSVRPPLPGPDTGPPPHLRRCSQPLRPQWLCLQRLASAAGPLPRTKKPPRFELGNRPGCRDDDRDRDGFMRQEPPALGTRAPRHEQAGRGTVLMAR